MFETIEGLMQLANIGRVSCINIAWRLLHVDFLLEMAMKKSIRQIKLFQRPITTDNNGKN